MKLQTVNVNRLDKATYKALLRMGYKYGRICEDLVTHRVWKDPAKVVVLKNDDGKPVSWALIDCTDRVPVVMFWTSYRHRGKGYGTMVLQRVKRVTKGKFKVYYEEQPRWFSKRGLSYKQHDVYGDDL